jgi:predicted Zn-dependent peptidase
MNLFGYLRFLIYVAPGAYGNMRKHFTPHATCLGVCAAAILLHAGPALAQQVPAIEKRLANGMRLLMVERHDEPIVSGGWVAHVGSSNERLGITGIAHLFEHMMFKGTPHIGTRTAKRDIEIILAQEQIRDEMRVEEEKTREAFRKGAIADPQSPESRTERYKALEKDFAKLAGEQRELLVKNEFDRLYTSEGASQMNAFTSEDITAYFINVPANKLELWTLMESERLLRPVFREFYTERDVVYEERRLRTESTPLGRFEEEFGSMFWQSCSYSWPVIGWPSDLPGITKAQADEFYATYYSPQNITLVLVGDFEPDKAEALVRRYFERIPRGKMDPPPVVTLEITQEAEKRMYAEADANPQVDILWHTVAFQHKDSYALDILAQLLSTRTGRLYKGLVLGGAVATEVYADQSSRKRAGYFNCGGEAREGKTPREVEEAIYAEIEKIKSGELPPEELQKVKNNFAASEYRRLSSNFPILVQLLIYDGMGDWREMNEAGKKIQAVTADDVGRVASTYLRKENRAVATYTRKSDALEKEAK